jgi:aminoglycoside 2''-phosphotransferase
VVNHELVCRFAREDWAKEVLVQEAKLLEVVKRYVDLPVPQFEHLEPGFVSYSYIPGEPLSRNTLLKLSDNVRSRIISQLATFHYQLYHFTKILIQIQAV